MMLPLSAIHPIRQVKPSDHAFGKYKSVLASIREVGLIEPLSVHPQRGAAGIYLLLDGHVRLKALQELKQTEAFCLIATEDDAFTYNDKVSRLSLIQEHAMIAVPSVTNVAQRYTQEGGTSGGEWFITSLPKRRDCTSTR